MLMAYALTYCSFFMLSLAMKRHFQQLFPQHLLSPGKTLAARSIGWLLFAATLFYCVYHYGWATGLVVVVGLSSAAIFMLSLLLNYTPRLAPGMAIVALAVGVL